MLNTDSEALLNVDGNESLKDCDVPIQISKPDELNELKKVSAELEMKLRSEYGFTDSQIRDFMEDSSDKDSEAFLNVDGNESIKDPEEANAPTRQYLSASRTETENHHTCRPGMFLDTECLPCRERFNRQCEMSQAMNRRKPFCFTAANQSLPRW